MRTFFLLLALAHGALAGIVWEQPTQNFEAVQGDAKVAAKFSFVNKGKAPVTVTGIETSCGCTTAELEKKTYAPGETGEITVVFTLGGRVGKQEKRVGVTTSDSDDPATLTMRVNIRELFSVHPLFVYWQDEEKLEPKQLAVTLAEEVRASALRVTSSSKRLAAEVREVEKGRAYQIVLMPERGAETVTAELEITAEIPGRKALTAVAYARLP